MHAMVQNHEDVHEVNCVRVNVQDSRDFCPPFKSQEVCCTVFVSRGIAAPHCMTLTVEQNWNDYLESSFDAFYVAAWNGPRTERFLCTGYLSIHAGSGKRNRLALSSCV